MPVEQTGNSEEFYGSSSFQEGRSSPTEDRADDTEGEEASGSPQGNGRHNVVMDIVQGRMDELRLQDTAARRDLVKSQANIEKLQSYAPPSATVNDDTKSAKLAEKDEKEMRV